MRVLMIAPEPVLEPRGTPISVYQRLYGLSKLGHQVDLLTYHLGRDFDLPGVTIERIPSLPWIRQVKIGPSINKVLLDLLLIVRALWLLLTRRYDLIHSHEEAAFFSMALAALFGKPHLYDMHSSLPQQLTNFAYGNALLVKSFTLLERWTLRRAAAVITIGADLEQRVRRIAPHVPQIMIDNLPVQIGPASASGLNAAQVRARLGVQDAPLVVYTGSFERYQGLDLLLQAAQAVAAQAAAVRFLLVGGKPEQVAQWQQAAERLDVADTVLFVGAVPADEVSAYVEAADILVSPRTEGLSVPLKIYSYLHAARPIVATRIAAHTLVLDDTSALLVEPHGDALAAGILQLLTHPELGQRLSQGALTLAREKYSLDAYLQKLAQIYRTFDPAPTEPGHLSPSR